MAVPANVIERVVEVPAAATHHPPPITARSAPSAVDARRSPDKARRAAHLRVFGATSGAALPLWAHRNKGRLMIKNQLKRYFTALTLAAGTTVFATAPVMAESVACTASIIKLGNDTCTTGNIAANASGHFVHVSISGASAHWNVDDTVTGVTVGSGQTGTVSGLERTIFGLFGRYTLTIGSFVGAHGILNNT
jgi:hypothetical protein